MGSGIDPSCPFASNLTDLGADALGLDVEFNLDSGDYGTHKMVARVLCYVLGYLKTRYEWVFVDLPVAGTDTTMITDFALRSNDLFDLYTAVFSTENSDIMSVSTWFWQQSRPPEQGGSNLDLKRCVGVVNKTGGTDMDPEFLAQQIQRKLGMNVAGQIPVDNQYGTRKNSGEWGCPPALRQSIADLCYTAFGVSTWQQTPNTSGRQQPSKNSGLFKRRRKARTIN